MQILRRKLKIHLGIILSLSILLSSWCVQPLFSNPNFENNPIYLNNIDAREEQSPDKNQLSTNNPYQDVINDLGIPSQNETSAPTNYNLMGKLRDNINEYHQTWTPWLTRAAVHVAKVSDDGEFLVIGGGYLLDTELHIYRWNSDERKYVKVWEAGSGIITRDVYDVAFGDSDNNGLVEIAAASADGRVYLFEQAHIQDPIANLENRFDLVWKSDKFFQVSSVEFEDLDLDGDQDLIIGTWENLIRVFEYTDHSGYPFAIDHWIEMTERWVSPELDDKVQSIGVGDFNGNDLPDFVVGTFSGSVYVFENDGVVLSPYGIEFPFPNDNNYRQLWNSTGAFKPIWHRISAIATGDLDSSGSDKAVLLAAGQGVWALEYSEGRGFYLEQMMRDFEYWQMQGAYPLDHFSDWMVRDTSLNWNVGHYLFNNSFVWEPSFADLSIFQNSAMTGRPDTTLSVFKTNSTHKNASGTWTFGKGEELASNGNDDPDLYIVMGGPSNNPLEWNISLSNDLKTFHQINQTEISVSKGTDGVAFAIDVDPLFAIKRMTSALYIQMTLLGEGNVKEEKVNALFHPYVARPLTLAASVTISPLPFSYYDQSTAGNIVLLGGSDGRLMGFQYEPHNDIVVGYTYGSGLETWNMTQKYGMPRLGYNQIWDSFTDDFFTLETTIWSIQETPKEAYIPSWRYIYGTTPEFTNFMPNPQLLHHLGVSELVGTSSGDELIVSSRTNPQLSIRSSVSGNQLVGETNTLFSDINSYGDFSGKILTTTFAELLDDSAGEELITFPWYQDFTTPNETDIKLYPIIWKYQTGRYAKHNILQDENYQLFNFLAHSTTYPSATSRDVNGDGLIDIVLSNGRLAMLWNNGTPTNPVFRLDRDYFSELNERAPPNPIFSPTLWDYDQDSDYDISFSYGRVGSSIRYGMDFFENLGTTESPHWVRNAYLFKNPTTDGSLRFNNYTAGVVIPSNSLERSAESLWVYNPVQDLMRKLDGEVGVQTSYIIGTNPELMKLEINQLQSPTASTSSVNMGFSMVKSWSNLLELDEWTQTLGISHSLDGDNNSEIVVSDFDNNVYVFEHLVGDTYKIAYKTHDLNHTTATSFSPYAFQDLEGVSGDFDRTSFDHGNLLATGLDFNNDRNEDFVVTAALNVYVFSSTGFNDEFKLAHEIDYSDVVSDTTITEFSSLATSPDLDGRGTMIAISAKNCLFMLRYDPQLGWLESYQPLEGGSGFLDQPGNPTYSPELIIRAVLFGDLNQDGNTELWVGGSNQSSPEELGFLLALQSDYGNVHQIYDFSGKIPQINDFTTTDSDLDGNLELVIAHASGVDIWEVKKSDSFDLTRSDIISSDPGYGVEENVDGVFGTYESPVGLAPRANDLLRLTDGNYFTVYGIEEQNHDPFSGTEQYSDWTSGGGGRLHYNVGSDPTDGRTPKQNLLFNYDPKNISLNEILYQYWDGANWDPNATWIELYNPNNYPITLTGYTLAHDSSDFVTLTGTIAAGGYFVIAREQVRFLAVNSISADDDWFPGSTYELNRAGDTINLKDSTGTVIDSVSWGGVNGWDIEANTSTIHRYDRTDPFNKKRLQDSDSPNDWHNSTVLGGNPSNVKGTDVYEVYKLPWVFGEGGKRVDQASTKKYIIEYEPSVTQLSDGTIFVVGLCIIYGESVLNAPWSSGIKYSKAVLGRLFDPAGIPLTDTMVIDSIQTDLLYHTTPASNKLLNTGMWSVRYRSTGVSENSAGILVSFSMINYWGMPLYHGTVRLSAIQQASLVDEDYYVLSTNKTDSLRLENFTVFSFGITSTGSETFSFVFSGFESDAFLKQLELYHVPLNSSFDSQGIYQITTGEGHKSHPSIRTIGRYADRIAVAYERNIGGTTELVSVFSRDAGLSWTDPYVLETNDPQLILQSSGNLVTKNNAKVFVRNLYRPRVTDDGTGGIAYQFVARFLIKQGTDTNYAGSPYTYYGSPYNFTSNLFVGTIPFGHWFRFDDVFNVRAVAAGDSDNDLRNELFLSHDYRVSLVEITEESGGSVSYTQVWGYTPVSFISASPEQVNSSYVQFLVSDTVKERETGEVAIFDANGNGWPELIFTVEGGDVFTFEITDKSQPINDKVLITDQELTSNTSLTLNSATNVLISEVLYDPPNSVGERWVELYNPTSSPISLNGWKLNTSSGSIPLDGNTLNAKDYFVMGQDTTAFQALYPGVIPDDAYFNLALNALGDNLTLSDSNSVIVDFVAWGTLDQLEAHNTTIQRLSLYDTDSPRDWVDRGILGDPGSGFLQTPSNTSDNLLVDVNSDGHLDLIVADRKNGNGIMAWDFASDSLIWHYLSPGNISHIYLIEDTILGITTEGIFSVDLDGVKRYWSNYTILNPDNSHLFDDVNEDSVSDLIIATEDDIRAINPMTGDVLWDNTSKPDLSGAGYFDLVSGRSKNSTVFAVSSSDFSTYHMIYILDINGTVLQSVDITTVSSLDTNSRSAVADFDNNGKLDVAIITLDSSGKNCTIFVYNTNNLDLIFNSSIPVPDGVDLTALSIFARDANNDNQIDLILPISSFAPSEGTSLFPSQGYSSAIFAIDVTASSVLWNRYFADELTKLESFIDVGEEIFAVYSTNSGVFGLSVSGADVFWAAGDEEPITASFATGSLTNISYIAVTYNNGTSSISRVVGTLTGATNVILAQPYSVKTNTGILYGNSSISCFTFPVVVTPDDTERLLVAYKNGTLILRSFDQGELWRSQIDSFNSMTAQGVRLASNNYALAFKTDISNLYLLQRTTTTILANISTTASIVTSFSMDGERDLLLLHSVSGVSTLTIFDPVTQTLTWNYTHSSRFYYLDVGSFDATNSGVASHVIGLDSAGTASLIELPTSVSIGGSFPAPINGTKWIAGTTIENEDKLSDVYLLSDDGQIIRYRWNADGSITVVSYSGDKSLDTPSEIQSLKAVSNGTHNGILVNNNVWGPILLIDDGSAITPSDDLKNFYVDSDGHLFADYDNSGENSLVIVVGNSIVLMNFEYNVLETHSFPSEIIQLVSWRIDASRKLTFVAILRDGSIAVADPSGRNPALQLGPIDSVELINGDNGLDDQNKNPAPSPDDSSSFNMIQRVLVPLLGFSILFAFILGRNQRNVIRRKRRP